MSSKSNSAARDKKYARISGAIGGVGSALPVASPVAAVAGPAHTSYRSKKGRKAANFGRAYGREIGEGMGTSVLGGLVGNAVSHGNKSARLAGLYVGAGLGGAHGNYAAARNAGRRGDFNHNVHKSTAFSVFGKAPRASKVFSPQNLKDVKVKGGAQRAEFIERYQQKSNPFHKGAQGVRSTTSSPDGNQAYTNTTTIPGHLTKLGKGTVYGGIGTAYGGALYADYKHNNPKKTKSKVGKSMSVSAWGVDHGGEISKAGPEDKFKVGRGSLQQQGFQATKGATGRMTASANRGARKFLNPKSTLKHVGGGAAVGAGLGAGVGAFAKQPKLGAAVGSALGAAAGQGANLGRAMHSQNSAFRSSLGNEIKRGNVKVT